RESFLREKARENHLDAVEAATAREVATFVARTPIALIEVTRTVDAEDDSDVVVGVAFVVPCYGDLLDAVRDWLEADGYVLRHDAEGEAGSIRVVVYEHESERTLVSVRT